MGVNLTVLTTTFQSGELDPTLRGQRDLDAYKMGAKRLRNVRRRATGGMERRGGTEDLTGLPGMVRFEAFEFSNDQRYVVGLSFGRADIYDLEGVLQQTIMGAPWDAISLWELTTSQLGDDMIISHTGFWTKLLVRTGPGSFTLKDFAFDVSADARKIYQPYYKFVDPGVTITPSGSTGAINLVAHDSAGALAPVFSADHVGARFRLYDTEVEITAVSSGNTVNALVHGKLTGKLDLDPFKTQRGSTTVEVLHLYHGLSSGVSLTFSGATECGSIPGNFFDGSFAVTVLDDHRYTITLAGVTYHYWEDPDGDGTPTSNAYAAARLSEDGGGPNVEFNVANTPTRAWMEPSFSPVVGYPGACCFHEGRLWLAGSSSQPDGAWGSNALQFFRFDVGKGYDADSVQVATGTEDVSRTMHLVSNGDLIVMNAEGEAAFIVRDGEPITPSNARIKGQAGAGCSSVQPSVFDGAVIFTQANGLSVSELVFEPRMGRYESTMISTLAAHLIRSPRSIFTAKGSASRSEPFCHFANSDGTVAVFHSQRRENIAGFVLWEFGGGAQVISGCALGGYLYLCVLVRGAYRLYRMSDRVCLDGAVLHTNAAPQTNWVLDARVRNRVCSLVSELGYHGDVLIPANGAVTLDTPVKNLQAGDAYYPVIETLPPSVALATGPQDGKIKRIVRSISDFGDDSLAVTVNGCPIDTMTNLDDAGAAIRPVTSPYEMHHLGCERDPTLLFSQSAPLATWRVLSVLQEVVV